jgi:NAD+ diphosphatase
MTFAPGFQNDPTIPVDALWFVFNKGKLLTLNHDGQRPRIPLSRDLTVHLVRLEHRQFLGSLDGRPCFAAHWPGTHPLSEDFSPKGLRSLFWQLDSEQVWVAGRANHLVQWSLNHQFCGRCGAPTVDKDDERAKRCPDCGRVNYPRVSPAVIMAVLKEDRILLARSGRFPKAFYSVLAGFVEPGETLEECVRREIREEVGIEVDRIRYFSSQPWPFPDSLMVGFTARYAGGDIRIDGREIADAGWFSADDLPQIPPKISIARQLIDRFIDKTL